MSLSNSSPTVTINRHEFSLYSICELRTRLRWLISVHFVLATIVVLQLVTYHFPMLTNFVIPRPHLWEYLWLISVIPSMCALISFSSQRILLMEIFFRGTIVFGFGIIFLTIVVNFSDLLAYRRAKTSRHFNEFETQMFFNYPLIVLWYIFLIITVQIHLFSLYLSNCLLNNWKRSQTNKRN